MTEPSEWAKASAAWLAKSFLLNPSARMNEVRSAIDRLAVQPALAERDAELAELRAEIARLHELRDKLAKSNINLSVEVTRQNAEITKLCAENERLRDAAMKYQLDQLGIDAREADSVELAEIRAENERLKAFVPEWYCRDCNVVYPPPRPMRLNYSCPDCGRLIVPSSMDHRERDELRGKLAEAEREQDKANSFWTQERANRIEAERVRDAALKREARLHAESERLRAENERLREAAGAFVGDAGDYSDRADTDTMIGSAGYYKRLCAALAEAHDA